MMTSGHPIPGEVSAAHARTKRKASRPGQARLIPPVSTRLSRVAPGLLLLALVLSGFACRSDDGDAVPLTNPDLDEADASAIAGTLPGSFTVTPTGEATYTLPLVVPTGAAGVQPSLAIAYDSASGDGLLGMGFSITGLSSVTRCPLTMAHDRRIRAVRNDAEDGLCLDGARLVAVGQSEGATEYRTFPDSFAKVLAYPSKVTANPADTWKVFTRSGMILEYGGSADAAVMGRGGAIRSWLLRRAADRSGNAIDYGYTNTTAEDGHTVEVVPLRIRYAGNPAIATAREVLFAYEPKGPRNRRALFANGMTVESTKQLRAITTFGPGGAIGREYRFAYRTGVGSGRTLLRHIQECAADGSCKPRTSFAWNDRAPGFEVIDTSVPVPQSHLSAPMMMDVTGDGLDDLVVPTVPFSAQAHSDIPTTDWMVTRNRGPWKAAGERFLQSSIVAFSEDHNDAANDPVLAKEPDLKVQPDYGTPIDYNHDGRTDILVHDVHGTAFGAGLTWNVLLATPEQSFTLHDTGIPRPKHLLDGAPGLVNVEASVHLADVNGDGLPDLIQCERDPAAGGGDAFTWTLRLWTPAGPGFAASPRAIPALSLFHCAWGLQPVDLDADGKVDLVLPDLSQNQASPQQARLSLSYDEQSDTWEKESIGSFGAAAGRPIFMDVNGDGLPDVVAQDAMSGRLRAIVNTGDRTGARFGASVEAVTDILAGDFASFWGMSAVVDLDGDGRQDLLLPTVDVGGSASWTLLQSTGSTGDGTFRMLDAAIPFDEELTQEGVTPASRLGPRTTDIDGDGAPDLLLPHHGFFRIYRTAASHRDLLASVHDGLNAHDPRDPGNVQNLAIEYGTLIDRTITDDLPANAIDDDAPYISRGALSPACAYPLRCVVGPRTVVTGYALNNGADRIRRFGVQYRGGRYDRRGNGFLGFQAKITTDHDTGAGTLDRYEDATAVTIGKATTYPRAGQLHEQIRWTPDPRPGDPGRLALSFTTVTREVHPTSGGATYFVLATAVDRTKRQGSFTASGNQGLHAWLQLSAKVASEHVAGGTLTTTSYDDFGNVLGSVAKAADVDLTTTVSDVEVHNDPKTWLLGQLTHRRECSTAAGVTQCRTIERAYDPSTGLLVGQTLNADGDATMHLEVTYARDAFGNITTTTADDALGHVRTTSLAYDADGVFPVTRTNALGQVVRFAFDRALGVMTSRIDENQLTTEWRHDGFGRTILETRPDTTRTVRALTRTKDGGPGRDQWIVTSTTTIDGGADSVVQYDGLARPIHRWTHGTQTGAMPAARLVQETLFDDLGEHIARRSQPIDETTPSADRHYDEYQYDPSGRLIAHKAPWGGLTTMVYEGRETRITDPRDHETLVEHDALGRPVQVTDAATGITEYTYGPFGSLWTVTDPGGAMTTTLRDAYGRVRTSIDPDRGTTTLTYGGFDELVSSKDAAGRTVTFARDALGRLVERKDATGNGPPAVTAWDWDTAPMGTSGQLALGLLAEVTAPDGTATHTTYDALARPIAVERSIGGELFETGVTYDPFGRVATISYPDAPGLPAFTVQNDYDPHGHLLRVSNAAGTAKGEPAYWRITGTDRADRITEEAFGNGFTTTRGYDDAKDRIASIVTAKGTAPPVQDLAYAYDAKRNLETRHDALQADNPTELFQYDALDRLTCATFTSGPACPKVDAFTYDPSGNLLTKPGIAGTYTYDPEHPHAVKTAGPDSFVHDAVGNQIGRSGTVVAYTPFDLPKSFTPPAGSGQPKVTLEYDGDEARVRKIVGTETTVYVGDLYERTSDAGTGAVEHRYFVHGAERVVAVVTRTAGPKPINETRYLHVDHLGSVETVTGETGSQAIEKRSYDAFGKRRNPTWGSGPIDFSSVTTKGFTGHEDDAEIGLVNMRGRLYDPQIGRFLTTDPIVAEPGSGQSWNPYSYVLNNPLAYTDPSGFAGETPDGSTLVDLAGGLGLHYTAPPKIGPPPPPPAAPKVVASQVGLGKAPGVVGPTGDETRPEEEPTVDGPPPGMAARVRTDRMPGPAGFDPSFGKDGLEIGAEVARGALEGVGGAVGDALSIDLLHVPTGLIRIVGDAWSTGDPVGGLSAIFWEPGRAQVDQVVASAVEGDFEGAAEAGVNAITVGVATGVVIGEIGGAGIEAAEEARKTSTLEPGPYARESIPAHRGRPTAEEQRQVNELMEKHGCHTCGAATPSTKSGNAIADHQPPQALGEPKEFLPHCNSCKARQGGEVLQKLRKRGRQ